MSLQFAVIGLNHNHIYIQTDHLLNAGAELVWVYAIEPELLAEYQAKYPQVKLADSVEQILNDPSIQIVANAGIPDERAPMGLRVMQAGKDYITDKPGFTTLDQLAEVKRVQAETRRIYSVFFSEMFDNTSTYKVAELIAAGEIGRVVHVSGVGPHRLGVVQRPDWFWQRVHFGGIINDLASHQVAQFLYFTHSLSAEVVASQVANFAHPNRPELEDFGDVMLRNDSATGYFRVDWFTPDGLGTWGDVRLFITGTEGQIEVRKNIDIANKPGRNHVYLVNGKGTYYYETDDVELPYGKQFLADVVNRTETHMAQAMTFAASELALVAEAKAARLGGL